MRLAEGQGENWRLTVEANQDAHSVAAVRYARRWAELMEERMAAGEALEAIAEATSHAADTEGISGFLYNVAAGWLAGMWIEGERLRRWYNLRYQLGDEGERANEKGTILNTALLHIGPGDEG